MSALLDAAALVVACAGVLLSFPIGAVAGLRPAVKVLLDFLLAAGLLRLSVDPEWERLLTAAVVVAIRHVLTAGLQIGTVTARRAAR
ncbi:DUF1622 domain-containing protein [Georgenia sp. EYE_87]|uniref:DUF1622 domain-containing protein n=1 Tax=Georgenia sp. EYE_87 TaxID=2853448 RepID=UPI0020030491|nr:DUF1622 domain-containing protein [Georgenia sp. EYE_87]MCK6210745.1 DUF1622 domain-containing protein [Georgenia sp. EYE_87]